MSPTGRARARRGEGERLRGEILDAAESLLVEGGDAGAISMRAIAGRVGVAPAALYLHFPDRATLLRAVCARRFAEFTAEIRAAFASADDPVESLRAGGRAYVRFALGHPEAYRVLFELPPPARAEEASDEESAGVPRPGSEAFAELVAAIERGIAAGAFRPSDPHRTALVVWMGLHGLVTAHRVGIVVGSPDIGQTLDATFDITLHGLCA